jgi:hypothetical protein
MLITAKEANVQPPVCTLLAVLAISQSAPASEIGTAPERVGPGWTVVHSVAKGPSAHLIGKIVRVQRAPIGSGVLFVAHTLSIQTDDGLRHAYVTSGDPDHDILPRVGDRCDLTYRLAQTDAGPGPLMDEMRCNGRALPLLR